MERFPEPEKLSTERYLEVGSDLNAHLDEPVSPIVAEFARTLIKPYQLWHEHTGNFDRVSPSEMIDNTHRLLVNLRTQGAREDVLNRYVEPELRAATEDQIAEMYLAVPDIMRASYPPTFADEVDKRWDKILKHWGYRLDVPDRPVENIDPITETVSTVLDAKSEILDSTKQQILDIDWQWVFDYDIAEQDLTEALDRFVPQVLRSNRLVPAVTIYHSRQEAELIERFDADSCLEITPDQTLVMLMDTISAEDATFIRDQLLLGVVDEIASMYGSWTAGGRVLNGNPGLTLAAIRSMNYMHRPDADSDS